MSLKMRSVFAGQAVFGDTGDTGDSFARLYTRRRGRLDSRCERGRLNFPTPQMRFPGVADLNPTPAKRKALGRSRAHCSKGYRQNPATELNHQTSHMAHSALLVPLADGMRVRDLKSMQAGDKDGYTDQRGS